ncbi:MAG: permease [Cyanobacteria bacterium SW_10_48_33]|nr:MAG: permease [Cyanobacteria bacterium QS_6_48_18]PSP08045.1 MAG: permease [Cyanobacteria bacterium SW_10_48_33]
MTPTSLVILAGSGLFAGILAGFLGIGGGTVLVPLLVAVGYTPVESVATSSLSIIITAVSGSFQNWRMGNFHVQRVLLIGLPAVVTAQIGAAIASRILPYYLLGAFGLLLLFNIYLIELRKRLTQRGAEGQRRGVAEERRRFFFHPMVASLVTGGAAGMLAGLFGIGGGAIMVPLQIILLGERIKTAIQTSLGVIVITGISACVGHAFRGNILLWEGLILGAGGLMGAQISTRFLPKLPNYVVSLLFRTFLVLVSVYIFWQAWQSYSSLINN